MMFSSSSNSFAESVFTEQNADLLASVKVLT
jgi:hypothetical protein